MSAGFNEQSEPLLPAIPADSHQQTGGGSCRSAMPGNLHDALRSDAIVFLCLASVVALHTYYLDLLDDVNSAAKRVDPSLSVSKLLVINKPEVQRRFWRHMAHTSGRWRSWSDWSFLLVLGCVYLRLFVFLQAGNQASLCVPHDHWPQILLVVFSVVVRLPLIDYSKDVRRWWWANSIKLVLIWSRMMLMYSSPTYRACVAEQTRDRPCLTLAIIVVAAFFVAQIWCPVSMRMAVISAPLQIAAHLVTFLHLVRGEDSPYGQDCLPMLSVAAGGAVAIVCGNLLNAWTQRRSMLRFFLSEL